MSIRECQEHGYFRDDYCPICGEEGKFIMSDYEIEKLGRNMAGILRHGKYDLPMDDQGYVRMRDIIAVIKEKNQRLHWLRPHHIEALVSTEPKGRYQISQDCVRATYGHTIELDLKLNTDNVPEELYYPTNEEDVEDILENGLYPTDRSMVHLSLTFDDAFRAGLAHEEEPIILAIDVDKCFDEGYDIGKAAKTVFLCKMVPPDCIRIIHEEELNE